MPNSSRPSSIAATAVFGTGFRTMANSPEEPVKSRFQSAWPGSEGRAGCSTRATSTRLPSHRQARSPIADGARAGRPRCASPEGRDRHPQGQDRAQDRRVCSLDRARGLVARSDRAEHGVGMTDDIFGGGLDRDVDPVRERLEEERRRPGVVHDHHGACFMRGLARSPECPAPRSSASRATR